MEPGKRGFMSSKPARFERVIPGTEAVTPAQREPIDEAYLRLESVLRKACPPSRELSHAFTKLEESRIWAYLGLVAEEGEEVKFKR